MTGEILRGAAHNNRLEEVNGSLDQNPVHSDANVTAAIGRLDQSSQDRLLAIRERAQNEGGDLMAAITALRAIKNETRSNPSDPNNAKLALAVRLLEREIIHDYPVRLAIQNAKRQNSGDPNDAPLVLLLKEVDAKLHSLSVEPSQLEKDLEFIDATIEVVNNNPSLTTQEKEAIIKSVRQHKVDLQEKLAFCLAAIAVENKSKLATSFQKAIAVGQEIPLDKSKILQALNDLLLDLVENGLNVDELMIKIDELQQIDPSADDPANATPLADKFNEIMTLVAHTLNNQADQELKPAALKERVERLSSEITSSNNDTCAPVQSKVVALNLKHGFFNDLIISTLQADALSNISKTMVLIKSGIANPAQIDKAIDNFYATATISGVPKEDKELALEILNLAKKIALLKSEGRSLEENSAELPKLAAKLEELKARLDNLPANTPTMTIISNATAMAEALHTNATVLIQEWVTKLEKPYLSLESEVGPPNQLTKKSVEELERAREKLTSALSEEKPQNLGAVEISKINHRLRILLAAVENAPLAKKFPNSESIPLEGLSSQQLFTQLESLEINQSMKMDLRTQVIAHAAQKKASLSTRLTEFQTANEKISFGSGPELSRRVTVINQELDNFETLAKSQLIEPYLSSALEDIGRVRSELNERITESALELAEFKLFFAGPQGEARKAALRLILQTSQNNGFFLEALARDQASANGLLQAIVQFQQTVEELKISSDPTADQQKSLLASVVMKNLYDLVIDRPELYDIALAVAKATLGENTPESEINGYHDQRALKQRLFQHLSQSKIGSEFLTTNEITNSDQLDHNLRHNLLLMIKQDEFSQTNFNLLLAQSLWNDYKTENRGRLNSSPESENDLLRDFIALYPALGGSTPEELKGYFDHGAHRESDFSANEPWAQQAASQFFVDQEMERVSDSFLASNPRYAARRARDIALRRVTNSMGVTYDPSKTAVERMRGVADSVRAQANALASADRSSSRSPFPQSSPATFEQQGARATAIYRQNAATIQTLQRERETVARVESELAVQLDQRSQISEADRRKFATLPQTDPERKLALTHPALFLHYQGAYRPPEGVIAAQVKGETMALRLAAFSETLAGRVQVTPSGEQSRPMTAAEQVQALKYVTIPKYFNLAQMRSSDSVLGRVSTDVEGARLLKLMREIKNLNPTADNFEADYTRLKNEYETMVSEYKLSEKADLILAFRVSSASSQTTAASSSQGLTPRAHLINPDGALSEGLTKMWGGRRASQAKISSSPNGARLIQERLTRAKSEIRGAGVNLRLGRELTLSETRQSLQTERRLLEEAEASYSHHTRRLMEDLTTAAIFSAFDELQIDNFEDAANQIKSTTPSTDAPLYQRAWRILTDGAGLSPEQAHQTLRLHLVNPVLRASGTGAEVFESLYNRATPSKANRQELRALDPEARQAFQAKETRLRTEAALDRLTPGDIMDFSDGAILSGQKIHSAPAMTLAAFRVATKNGLAIAKSPDGSYSVTMANKIDAKIGFGAKVRTFMGIVNASLDGAVTTAQGLTFNFSDREQCLRFLDGLANGRYSSDLVARTARDIQVVRQSSVGVTLHDAPVPKLSSANAHLADPYDGHFYPSPGKFVAAENAETSRSARTERTDDAEIVTVSVTGSVTINQLDNPATNQQVDTQGANQGNALTASSLSATSTATIERSDNGTLAKVAQGLTVNFTAPQALEKCQAYLRDNLGLEPEKVEQIIPMIRQQISSGAIGPDFAIQTQHALKPEALEAINDPTLDPTARAATYDRIIKTPDSYERSGLRLLGERPAFFSANLELMASRRGQATSEIVELSLMESEQLAA
jgi:hypothetical protein